MRLQDKARCSLLGHLLRRTRCTAEWSAYRLGDRSIGSNEAAEVTKGESSRKDTPDSRFEGPPLISYIIAQNRLSLRDSPFCSWHNQKVSLSANCICRDVVLVADIRPADPRICPLVLKMLLFGNPKFA